MANGNITRREFYSALVGIWCWIGLILGNQLRAEGRWTTAVLFVTSIVMTSMYAAKTIRSTDDHGERPTKNAL
jgi:hypothetical protein